MNMMRQHSLVVYGQLLRIEHERVRASLNRFPAQSWTGDVRSQETEPAITHDQYLALAVNDLELHKLRQVQASLQRLRDGIYGSCEICEQRISEKRLRVLPWANVCLHCAAQPDVRADTHGVLSHE